MRHCGCLTSVLRRNEDKCPRPQRFSVFQLPFARRGAKEDRAAQGGEQELVFPLRFASSLLSLSSHPLTLLSEKHLFLKVCTAATNCAVHALYTLLRRVQSFASTELLTCTRRWRRLRSPARPAPSPPLLSVSASLSPSVRNTD